MKRLLAALVALTIGGAVHAANPVSVEVWVQVQNLSIAVTSSTTYDYGIQQFAASAVQGTKFTFQNNGNASEQFQYGVDNPNSTALTAAVPIPGLWTLVTTAVAPGAEQVRLGLVSKTTAAVGGDFAYPLDGLTTGLQTAGSAPATIFVADAGSVNPVPVAASRDVYTQITLPSSTVQFTHVKLVVQANAIP